MKKIFVLLAIIILSLSGLYVYQKSVQIINKQEVKKITVSQALKGKTPAAEFISYQAVLGETALDLLKRTADIKTKGEGANAYVTSINGTEALNSKKEFWAFYVNGKLADVGAGGYKLKSGDKLEWKIEKY